MFELAFLFLAWIAPAESPRLDRLRADLSKDKTAAADQFWREREKQGPLVETIAGDDEHLLVTFLWRGDAALERVEVRGGPYASSREPFERIADTDVWYRSERLPKDARYVYGLIVTRTVEKRDDSGTVKRVREETYPLDPLNPRTFNAGPVIELPDAPADKWHAQVAESARGKVTRFKLDSAALGETRGGGLYTPANFDPAQPHALAVFLDGEESEKLLELPTVFDNLIAAKKIPPTVALFVDAEGKRGRDLVFSDKFVDFLGDELVPWAMMSQKLDVRADTTLIGGASLGGLTAAYTAQRKPQVFGNVLSQSGAFWRKRPDAAQTDPAQTNAAQPKSSDGALPGEIASRYKLSIRYYLEVGRFEAPSMIENNRRLRDILREKGNEITYVEYNGGHDHFNWRVSVGDGLIALLGDATKKPRAK
jgi:enterochelin esterase-like enzyme